MIRNCTTLTVFQNAIAKLMPCSALQASYSPSVRHPSAHLSHTDIVIKLIQIRLRSLQRQITPSSQFSARYGSSENSDRIIPREGNKSRWGIEKLRLALSFNTVREMSLLYKLTVETVANRFSAVCFLPQLEVTCCLSLTSLFRVRSVSSNDHFEIVVARFLITGRMQFLFPYQQRKVLQSSTELGCMI